MQLGDGTTDGSIAATSAITNNATLRFNLLGNQTASMDIGGTGVLTKSGAGTLTLTGTNAYTGATTINAGTLAFDSTAALGATASVSIGDTATLAYTGGTATFDRDLTVSSGTGFLRNSGGGTLTLSGTLTKNATTLTFAQGLFAVTGTIVGASAQSDLVVDAATVTLSGANTYNGPTILRNGAVLTAAVAGALPTATRSALSLDATGTGSSTLVLGADQVVASLSGAASSAVTLGAHALTVGTGSGTTSFAGVLAGTGGRLVKDGASALTLTGVNTYTGTTTVSGGTLTLNAAGGAALANTSAVAIGSGATVALGAAQQINSAATVSLTGGTLALHGFNQTLGTLELGANSTLDLSGAAELVFADSSALTWSAATLSVVNFTTTTNSLRFGTTSGGLSADQLARFRFVAFGNSTARIEADGSLAPTSINVANVGGTDVVLATPITGTTTVTQSGTGTTTLTAPASTPNTSTGLALVTQGTLVIGNAAGGNWAGDVTVSGTGILKGRGDIGGAVLVDAGGTYSPGTSPAIQHVATLTVNPSGFLVIELDGASAGNGDHFHDQVVSAGAVNLTGDTLTGATIFTGATGYTPALGAGHTIITGSAITGTFGDHTFNPADNAAGISFLPAYSATALTLFAVPANYGTALANLTANQTQVGQALESLRPEFVDQRVTLDATGVLFNRLIRLDAAGLLAAYNELNPEKFSALSAASFQGASVVNSALRQRSAELRLHGPASVSLNGVARAAPAAAYVTETVIEDGVSYQIAKANAQGRLGYFASATGAFSDVEAAPDRLGYQARAGAASCGFDYALNAHHTIGLVVSQYSSDAEFAAEGGSAQTSSQRLGVFYDYQRDGFYLNASVSGGVSAYETDRQLGFLSETARGETEGTSVGGQIAVGYDFKVGNYVFEPRASVSYDHTWINGFSETGSAGALRVGGQQADSVVTAGGLHVTRPFSWQGIGWIPEVSFGVSRQHYNPNRISAQLVAGGAAMTVKPQAGGSEYINPGVSLTALLPQDWSVRLSYDAVLNTQSADHRFNLNVSTGF